MTLQTFINVVEFTQGKSRRKITPYSYLRTNIGDRLCKQTKEGKAFAVANSASCSVKGQRVSMFGSVGLTTVSVTATLLCCWSTKQQDSRYMNERGRVPVKLITKTGG